jgi:hypothetical protein
MLGTLVYLIRKALKVELLLEKPLSMFALLKLVSRSNI